METLLQKVLLGIAVGAAALGGIQAATETPAPAAQPSVYDEAVYTGPLKVTIFGETSVIDFPAP
jgi:hypothetical protein